LFHYAEATFCVLLASIKLKSIDNPVMNLKWFIYSFFLVYSAGISIAQETPDQYIGFDWGFAFFKSKPSDTDHIRGDVTSFHTESSTSGLVCISFRSSSGVKFETYRVNSRIGLAAGLRFSKFVQNMGKWGLLATGVNHFYWLYNQEGVITDYARVKSISQTSNYMGFPAEIRFFASNSYRRVRLYFKAGAEMEIRLRTKTEIRFKYDSMKSFENVVTSQVSKPSFFGMTLYNCIGLNIGGGRKPSLGLEAFIPVLNRRPGSPGLLSNIYGGGLQFNLQIPVQSKMR